MADKRFFKKSAPKAIKEIARIAGAEIDHLPDPKLMIEDVAALDQAGPGDISFLDNIKYKDAFTQTKAAACIVSPGLAPLAPEGVVLLLSKNPYKSYALVAQAFYPEDRPESSVSEKASIHADAVIAKGCVIEEGAIIRAGARLGKGCWVGPHVVIGENVELGEGCRIGANAVISHAIIGDHVRIYRGCAIGQDGFGFAIDPAGHVKVPQLGRVIIESNVEIGANTTIDRGSGPDTVIGQGTWIDNLVQIGHNVKIGRGCVIVAQAGVSGSSVIEDYAVLAGQAGIAGHLRIGKGARIGAQAGVMRDVSPGMEVLGSPALPIREHLRQISTLRRLAKKKKGSGNER